MSKKVIDVALADLLPSSIKTDADIAAMAESANPLLREISTLVPFLELYKNIDILPEPILRLLAWENNVMGIEWELTRSIDERRTLIKDSFKLNVRRGTRWAVERVFDILGLQANIIEWWEDGSDPFTFKINVLDVGGRGISYDEIELLDKLVSMYKPLTRHSNQIDIGVDPALPDAHVLAAVTMMGSLLVGGD